MEINIKEVAEEFAKGNLEFAGAYLAKKKQLNKTSKKAVKSMVSGQIREFYFSRFKLPNYSPATLKNH